MFFLPITRCVAMLRRSRLALFLAGLSLLASTPALAPAQESGVVRGTVRAVGASTPLVGAIVELSAPGALSTVAGLDGRYSLSGVAPGRRLLRARHLGYVPLEVEVIVPAGGQVAIDLALRPAPVLLEPVSVEASGALTSPDTIAAAASDLAPAAARAFEVAPGVVELGISESARGVPGQQPVDPADVLYVRGAGTDLKLVYLDGAPVYAPFPLGGLLHAFSPDLLSSASVYLGGAPARYDGGLSYVLDLATRGVRSDRIHSSGAVDLLAARGNIEVPLGGRSGLLLAGRTIHDIVTGEVAAKPLPYGYSEALGRMDLGVGTGTLSFTGFGNAERVWLDDPDETDQNIRWGNSAGSLRYRGSFGGTAAELTAAIGTFTAGLPLEGKNAPEVTGEASRTRLAADFARRSIGLYLRYGASFDRQRQLYRTEFSHASGTDALVSEVSADAAGAYVEMGTQLSSRVSVRAGFRADHFSLVSDMAVAPRLSATWLVSDRAALTLAGGMYHQYLRPPREALENGDASEDVLPPAALVLGRSSHVSLTLDQDLGESVRLGLEGFYKEFEGVPGGNAAAANASGVDVWLRRDHATLSGYAGYSLAWVWSQPDLQGNTRFSGRHLLTFGLDVPLGEAGSFDTSFTYGAGWPYTAIPLSTELVSRGMDDPDSDGSLRLESVAGSPPLLPEPARPYVRLDLGFARTWTLERGGATYAIAPYFRLLNTLGHRDALFYRYNRKHHKEPEPLLLVPFVPVLGLEWKF